MVSQNPSEPPDDSFREDLRDLTRAVTRLARNVETFNRRAEEKPAVSHAPGGTEIRYLDTIRPPGVPRRLSWHEKVREKRMSLPVTAGWTLVGTVLFELGKALIEGRLHF